MMRLDQLGLLLWKNYVVRKRRPGILCLVFLWPVFVFLLLYVVRDNVDPQYNPTCQFPGRLMPHDGVLPFVQSYICSIGNPCEPLSKDEEVPSYENATLGPLIGDLQSILRNDTILGAVKTLPSSVQLLQSMAQILTKPEIKKLFDKGIYLGDLFEDHEKIKTVLKRKIPEANGSVIDGLFDASVKLSYLIETFGSSNIDGVVCSPEKLKEYLILPKAGDVDHVSDVLCHLDSKKIPDILEHVVRHLDFTGLLEMVDRATAQFRNYDFFDDLQNALKTVTKLSSVKKYVPSYLKLDEWLPKIIPVFKNVSLDKIDTTFMNRSLAVMDPIFENEDDWPVARSVLVKFSSLLSLVDDIIRGGQNNSTPNGAYSLSKRIGTSVDHVLTEDSPKIEEVVDVAYVLLRDLTKLTHLLIDHHRDDIEIAAEVLDGLLDIAPMNTISYILSLLDKVVRTVYHVTVLHEETAERMYNVSRKHRAVVQNILSDVDPLAYQTVVRTFSKLNFTERFMDNDVNTNAGDLFCREAILIEIFENFENLSDSESAIRNLMCGEDGKKLISDVFNSFDFNNFREIVTNTLSTFISVVIKRPVATERANVSSIVRNVRRLISYLETPTPPELDWRSEFQFAKKWSVIFNETKAQGRLNILGMHLGLAKNIGSRSLSYSTIEPDLQQMDVLADMILYDLRLSSTEWIGEVRKHLRELIETFYLTVTDREKTLKILEHSSFTDVYCLIPNPPPLLNYPSGANVTLLKSLICRLSKAVENELEMNLKEIEKQQALTGKTRSFDWTAFNGKIVELYEYIDTLIEQEESESDSKMLDKLKYAFSESWTKNITLRDALEISVGLICKVFDLSQSPLFFNDKPSEIWNRLNSIAWAADAIFGDVEDIVDQLVRNNASMIMNSSRYDLPTTEILISAILRNLAPITLDIVDMTTTRIPVHFISEIVDFKVRETDWPCLRSESLGDVLELRNGSREVVREIERIACNPGRFVMEWQQHPTMKRVIDVFKNKDLKDVPPPFDWSLGYANFRRLNNKIDFLLEKQGGVDLNEVPTLHVYSNRFLPEVKTLYNVRLSSMAKDVKNFLHYLDFELNKAVNVFHSNLTAAEVWKWNNVSYERATQRLLVVGKFSAAFIREALTVVLDIFSQASTSKIDLLPMLGFKDTSFMSIAYLRFPDILATVANGVSNPMVELQILTLLKNPSEMTCVDVFSWFAHTRVGISEAEYDILKNFICGADPENFNAFTDLFLRATELWKTPVSSYQSYFASVAGDLYELGKMAKDVASRELKIELPFGANYFNDSLTTLKKQLVTKCTISAVNLEENPNSRTYLLMFAGISEVLSHMARSLNRADIKDNQLHLWELAEHGDVRQLLMHFEAHPQETIALLATLLTYYKSPSEDFRSALCNSVPKSSQFWKPLERMHFLNETCSFDLQQVFKSATSEMFYDAVVKRSKILPRFNCLSVAIDNLVDAAKNLTAVYPAVVFTSNIFNLTTLRNLDNDTWSVVRNFEDAWTTLFLQTYDYYDTTRDGGSGGFASKRYQLLFQELAGDYHLFVVVSRLGRVLGSTLELLSGGDVWQKLRVIYENSRAKPVLTIIEDTPNLLITTVDTFLNSDNLNEFAVRLVSGQADFCDVEKYLIEPSFMRKRGLLSSIGNFCQKIVLNDERLRGKDFLPFGDKINESYYSRNGSAGTHFFNKTYLVETIERFSSILLRVSSEGFKEPKVPAWWTSFEEGTLKDFSRLYKNKDTKAMSRMIAKKLTSLFKNVVELSNVGKNCTWCNTVILDILNIQLSRHAIYKDLACNASRLNFSRVQEILLSDFQWKETISMVKGFKFLSQSDSLPKFTMALEQTVQYVVEILFSYSKADNGQEFLDCLTRAFGGGRSYAGPGLYVSLLAGAVDFLGQSIHIVDTASNHEKLQDLARLAEKNVPIWKPIRDVIKKSNVELVDRLLPNASINVNMLIMKDDLRKPEVLYDILSNSKRSRRLLRNYDPTTSNISSIVEVFKTVLDRDLINREITNWRQEAIWDFTWLREILRHVSMALEEGGTLLDVVGKVDFKNISESLGVPNVIDGIVTLLRERTIDTLFDELKEILEDIDPFINDSQLKKDLLTIVETFESMEIFKNLGLVNMKYPIKDIFVEWNVLKTHLKQSIDLPEDVAYAISHGKIDMLSIFAKERHAFELKDIVCSPEKLRSTLNFDGTRVTAEDVSAAFCELDPEQSRNVSVVLLRNLNFEYIFKNLMSANVKNILSNANLTETEGKAVLENLGVAGELVPFFKEKLSAGISSARVANVESADDIMTSTSFLQDTSVAMCGKPLLGDEGQLYRVIAKLGDNEKEYDQAELASLPTDFCRDTYKSVLRTTGGKILWSYAKPLLRGRILYAPNTTVVNKVMQLANETFSQMDKFHALMTGFEKTLASLANLAEMGDNLKELQEVMSSDTIRIAVKSLGGKDLGEDFTNLDLSEVAWRAKGSSKLRKMSRMIVDLLDCVLVDRMVGYANEEDLEKDASVLVKTNEFLAGVVFLEDAKESRSRRSLDEELPLNVTYKIRMDVDYVPSTKRLKNQFWLPGPEGNFVEDLRYLRGFVQLQDMIDRAIVKLKTGSERTWKTITRQMPYPCWKYTPFQSTLYESQGLQVCFFFALMLCVGTAVRHIVWDRESQNAMVMSVMGLKPWRNTLAWFATSFIELSIVVISICLILTAGRILPHSNPALVLLLLFDYIFSIITFCYMISTMFSSASLAAITSVVAFLLTYMPYVIVIAMEANMNLGYKLLICLSMSTSFSYGCLFAVRREVQGTGLTWESVWEESSPGDQMSLGLALVMIAVDGCLYALIAYLISRYINSGKGLHGLRSRSLWWTNTQALYGNLSYFNFVNHLYFTNDDVHPLTTYQDAESDAANLTVNEKQVGVRFEGVRKVYGTEFGDVVAVDDFTLKLCEGEVTTLLGRNGAGKTTIIKMLTGMVAPTCGEICLNGENRGKPDIGVCPQDNVLIDMLTPREHMIFYARLKKRATNEEIMKNVEEMLASMELGRQERDPVYRLSGGTKRRLCVALAFLGSPQLVILDEPGSGVDPAARRRIWRLIDKHRIGRTVLLSTHHLDEADMLSDTVVVMHRGKILCTGSPLTLKTTYGRGYKLTVSFSSHEMRRAVEEKKLIGLQNLLEDVIPNVVAHEVSGNEAFFTLPFQEKAGVANDHAEAAKVLEENQRQLGFSHFSLECDTLERVFLELCSRAEPGSSRAGPLSTESLASVHSVDLALLPEDAELVASKSPRNPSVIRQMKALLKKRLWHFSRDWRAPLTTLILPTIFVAVAMGFSLIRPPSGDEPTLVLSPRLYDARPTYFYSIDNSHDQFLQHVSLQLHDRFGGIYAGAWQASPNDTGTCECNEGQQVCQGVSQAIEGLIQTIPGRPTLDWIVSTHREYIEKRYGGWSLSHSQDDPLFVVWYNNKGHHALPAYLSALNEAILRASGFYGHLTTLNHPIKLTSDQLNRTTLLQHVADVGVALVLLVAFSLVGAQGARELVRERLSEEKRILYLAGVHPATYWTTALIWDFLVFGCSICLAVIVFEIFGLSAYVARDNLQAVCLLLFLFAWAVIPFTHLAEKAFDDASVSNMVLFCLNTFIGVASLATILVIDILGKSEAATAARDFLHDILLFLPQYTLGDGLVQISTNDITAGLLERFHMDTYQSPLGWRLIGPHYVYLFVVGAALYLTNLVIECRMIPTLGWKKSSVEDTEENEDDDVIKERIRVEKGINDDVVRTVRLRKEYSSVYGTNVAVKSLSFGVPTGQCFGILGVNGAGKSTTFKMLTTELRPTAGRIMLEGREVGGGPLCSGEVGYCPQSDALDGFLTPRQCLTVHGEVCGLRDVPLVVEAVLRRFDLINYAHQRIDFLSGGNRRKLCAALSVMAPCSVILMDEPTSGMDPASKDLVARAVRRIIKNQGCVLMTSHSVADCENLCTRVGVLAKAGLKCIGSPQYLKHKYGEGYIAFLRFSQPTAPSDLRRTIARYLPDAIVTSRQALAARILIPRREGTALSAVFARVKQLVEEMKAADYTITQSSLDRVLLNLSEELEDELADVARGSGNGHQPSSNGSNVYTTRDVILLDTF